MCDLCCFCLCHHVSPQRCVSLLTIRAARAWPSLPATCGRRDPTRRPSPCAAWWSSGARGRRRAGARARAENTTRWRRRKPPRGFSPQADFTDSIAEYFISCISKQLIPFLYYKLIEKRNQNILRIDVWVLWAPNCICETLCCTRWTGWCRPRLPKPVTLTVDRHKDWVSSATNHFRKCRNVLVFLRIYVYMHIPDGAKEGTREEEVFSTRVFNVCGKGSSWKCDWARAE